MVSGDGEHYDAADATCDLRFGYGRMGSLRLYLHAETKKGPLSISRDRRLTMSAFGTKRTFHDWASRA